MNEIFNQWKDDLIPVNLKLDDEGKKHAFPKPWKDGQVYTKFVRNTIGLRTGNHTACVVDVDTKDFSQLTEPFKSWVEDRLMFEDTLSVESKNGYHFYIDCGEFRLRTTTKTGANKSPIPFIDFRGEGGLIFVHSDTEFANYTVLCDEKPIKMADTDMEVMLLLPEANEAQIASSDDLEGFINLDDPTDTSVSIPSRFDRTLDEIRAMLKFVSFKYNRDEFREVGASIYALTSDKKGVKELMLEWAKDVWGDKVDMAGMKHLWRELDGKTFGVAFTGSQIVNDYVPNGKIDKALSLLEKAENVGEMKKIFKGGFWHDTPFPLEDRWEEVAKAYKNKQKDLTDKAPRIADVRDIVFIKKEELPLPELPEGQDLEFFLENSKYLAKVNGKLIEELTKQTAIITATSLGITRSNAEKFIDKPTVISEVIKIPDYLIKSELEYTFDKGRTADKIDVLTVRNNPIATLGEYEPDVAVTDDFFKHIWKGKLDDIIQIIGLTVRFKENKLNKIMLVAPSNSGKTTMFEQMGFQNINMGRLVPALSAGKGIGKGIIDGLKSTGLLLIDEVNEALPQDIKNIDNYIHLDQFGQGGTQEIKLHFTLMTSTHKTATRTTSDEMFNRLLQVELEEEEEQYLITNSSLYLEDTARYSKGVRDYAYFHFYDAIHNPKFEREHLRVLQEKYRLPMSNDIDDLLYDTVDRVVANLKGQASTHGDVLVWHGDYFIKRKKDLVGLVDDLLGEVSKLDVGKYSEKLVKHLMPNSTTKSIKVDGKPVKYYPLNLKPYHATEAEAILSEFDNLEEF